MLKKLTKYGNSHALILDKAILDLLNMQEGDLLKIKTDGTSLIITPVSEPSNGQLVSRTGEEKLRDIMQQESTKKMEKTNGEALQHYMASQEGFLAGSQEFAKLFQKYSAAIQQLPANQGLAQELNELAAKYPHDTNSQAYLEEYQEIRYKHIPELRSMDAEMKEISKKIDNHYLEFEKEYLTKQQVQLATNNMNQE